MYGINYARNVDIFKSRIDKYLVKASYHRIGAGYT